MHPRTDAIHDSRSTPRTLIKTPTYPRDKFIYAPNPVSGSPMIKAITFDLWNTLLEDKHFTAPRLQATTEALNDFGISRTPEEIREAYRSAARAYRREWEEDHRHMTIDRRIRLMFQEIHVEPEEGFIRDVINRFEGCFLENPPALKAGVEETLNALTGRYRLGIISDTGITPGTLIREYLGQRGLLHQFVSFVFSDETGYCKPHPIQFEKALRELEVEPYEAIHVGDLKRTDVAGAQAIGMKAVWVQTDEKTAPDHPKPDYTVTQLIQILAIPELNHS
jgi:putative hydrolase of the HAD superfamily